MSQIYESRRRTQNAPAAGKIQTAVPGPSLEELAAGAAPSTEQMGHRVDLPGEIREKMEASFGADFSNVKLYESDTVAQAGAEAMTQGQNIAFAPGRLDLASTAGQALLGHELSHVVSQSRGESAGHGFLADSGLEAQADRQGMLAAQGESAYSGPVSPIGTSSTVSAAGPMQAKKKKNVAKDALDQGAKGDLSAGMERDFTLVDKEMNQALKSRNLNGSRLRDKGYYTYASRRVAAMQDEKERDDFLALMLGDDENAINQYIKNDALETTRGMTQASEGLTSEDFNTRAAAYAGSGSYAGRAKALQGNSNLLRDLLDERQLAEFQNAAGNFRGDRQSAMFSMQAYSADSDPNTRSTRASDRQRRLRKEYRNARREGTDAGFLIANREKQAMPSLTDSWVG